MNVYIIRNTANARVYVGLTSYPIEFRLRAHRRHARIGTAGKLYNAMRKHGPDSFFVVPLVICLDLETAQLAERHYIAAFDTVGTGYNVALGGEGRWGAMDDTSKDKMRVSARQRWDHATPEQKAVWFGGLKGRVRSAEFKTKVSAGMQAMVAKLPAGEMARRAACRTGKPQRKPVMSDDVRAARAEKIRAKALERYRDPEQRRLTAERTREQHRARREREAAVSDLPQPKKK